MVRLGTLGRRVLVTTLQDLGTLQDEPNAK